MPNVHSIENCKIGLYEKALPASLPWEKRLTIAKQSGYDFLEISIDETDERMSRLHWTDRQKMELHTAMYNSGVHIYTMCLSGNRRYTIGSENAQTREKGISLIKDAVAFSADLGIRIVQLASYDEFYNERNANTERLFLESLYEVTGFAERYAVTLAFENMDTPFIDSIEKAMKVVKEVDSPSLQVYPDVGNLAALGFSMDDIENDFDAGKGHIAAIHLKDTKSRTIRKIPYGEGVVDFAAFFAYLRKARYSGLFVAEMWTDESLHSIPYIATARDYLLGKMSESANHACSLSDAI